MVGGDDYRTRRSTSPRRGSASRARRSSRSCSRRRCARGSRPTRSGSRARAVLRRAQEGQLHRGLRGQQLREQLRRRAHAAQTPRRYSDNAVYAQVGIKVGTRKIARLRAPDGHPHAGLAQPRDDARRPQAGRHAARHGARLRDVRRARPADLRHDEPGLAAAPSAAAACPRAGRDPRISRKGDDKRKPIELPERRQGARTTIHKPVLQTSVADPLTSILPSVVAHGHGDARADPGVFVAGKTGTTENYGDAWFVGWTSEITVAVWVGYPDELRPMQTRVRRRSRWPAARIPRGSGRTFVESAMALGYGRRSAAAGGRAARGPRRDGRAARRHRRPGAHGGAGAGADARATPAAPGHPAAAAGAAAATRRRHRRSRAGLAGAGVSRAPAARAATAATRCASPCAQKRHGSSGALVIPMRVPATISGVLPARRPRPEPDRPARRDRSR